MTALERPSYTLIAKRLTVGAVDETVDVDRNVALSVGFQSSSRRPLSRLTLPKVSSRLTLCCQPLALLSLLNAKRAPSVLLSGPLMYPLASVVP